MMVYKWWFESQANLYPDINTFSLSKHGVKINGMPYKQFTALLGLPDIRDKLKQKIKDIRKIHKDFCGKDNRKILYSSLEKLKSELDKINDLSDKALKEVKAIEKLFEFVAEFDNR